MNFPLCNRVSSRRLFFVLVAVLASDHLRAQNADLEFEAYDTRMGLSQNQVFAIEQDKKGFLWFGTDEGLNRFDGYEFKVLRHDAANPNSISDNSVHGLAIDDGGVLWIGTSTGVCRYYPETELVEQLAVNYDDATKPKGTGVNEMKKDSQGRIWIAYLGSGVDVYDPVTNTFMHYTTHRDDEYRLINDYVISIQFMPDGDKLLGTRAGIQFIGSDGVPLDSLAAQAKYPWRASIDNSITSFYLAPNGKDLWIGTELGGAYRVDLRSNRVKNFNTTNSALRFNNNVPSVYGDSRGNIWIGGEAIYLYDKVTDALVAYDEHGVSGNIVNKNPVLSIFEDRDHNIWFGTFRLGVLKYNPDNTKILHYHSGQGDGSLSNDQVLSFVEDADRNVWVGTDGGGLLRLGRRGNFEIAPGSEKFSSQVIKCIYKEPDGSFWLGTWDGGMMKYDPRRRSVKIYNPENGNLPSRHVWDIKGDGNGKLWLGTLRDGLCHFDPLTGSYKYYSSSPEDSSSLVNNDIMCLYRDSQGRLWIGTSNGLSILPPNSAKFINFSKTVLNTTVLTFYEDSDGNMWLGTNGGGIVIMSPDLKIVRTITDADGLQSTTVCAMERDGRGNIWISSYNGLARLEPTDLAVSEIPLIAGLQGKEFIPRSSLTASNGQMLFGGVNGFNLFHPDSLAFTPIAKEVVFTSLRINNDEIVPGREYDGRKILDRSIAEIDRVELSYMDYAFTLSFSSLTYNWQETMHYSYFLEGLDQEWQYTTAEKRFIHYTTLSPGSYTLKVRSSFDGKTWPEEAKTLAIYIQPPWWGATWFRLAAGIFLVALLFTIYKTRVRFLQRQQEKLEDLVKVRTAELKKSNDEIQILLAEVAEQKERIEVQMHELKRVNEEIGAQRDTLELRSRELERAQSNLKEVNANLEILVQKRTEKLTDALRELETFLYRASHDLRGPISSMLGLISAAKLEKDPAAYNLMYSDYLLRTVMCLDRTLQKLLQKHLIEKRKIHHEKIQKPVLLILIQQILQELPFYRPDDFKVTVHEDVCLETDRMLLAIVIGNLLENAFFYSDRSPDKNVFLGVEKSNGHVLITVEDHGPGIKKELKDKIFTMFFRGHEMSTGNGLGLYLVKNVLGKINGSIAVETEEGAYSRFIVTIPQNGVEH